MKKNKNSDFTIFGNMTMTKRIMTYPPRATPLVIIYLGYFICGILFLTEEILCLIRKTIYFIRYLCITFLTFSYNPDNSMPSSVYKGEDFSRSFIVLAI